MVNPFKPEYLFRPSQLVRRVLRSGRCRDARLVQVLPWGLPLEISSSDEIGLAIWRLGVYEIGLCEVAWRLLAPGETACDVGANIGYVTSLLAARAGSSGRVLAFEPHPGLHQALIQQLARWKERPVAPVELHALALSDHPGTAWLAESPDFDRNCGTSHLGDRENADAAGYEVATSTIDLVTRDLGPIGLAKVDVEGHELSVFQGGRTTLASGRLRDLIFEEHHGFPSPPSRFLLDLGFTIFRIDQDFLGPRLAPPETPASSHWRPPNFLATRDPERATRLTSPRGWRVLRGG